jgi:ornithine carbamoyltransferase
MTNKHFLHISDYNKEELWEILELAKSVKAKFHSREDYPHFKNIIDSDLFLK